jgi:hypothetical protein
MAVAAMTAIAAWRCHNHVLLSPPSLQPVISVCAALTALLLHAHQL